MRILIMTYNNYPNGDAASIRQHSLSLLLKAAGHDICNIAMGPSTNFKLEQYDNIPYISFRNQKNNFIWKLLNVLGYKFRLKAFLKKVQMCDSKFNAIMVQGVPLYILIFIKRYCVRNNIQLMHDSVEWYSPEQFKNGKFSYMYIKQNLCNKYIIDNRFSVIAISKFLERHFTSRGISTIRIPAIVDVQNTSYNKSINIDMLTIVYAGSPGKKDYLKEVIVGLELLSTEELSRIELRIIGATKEQILINSGVTAQTLDKLGENIKILGRVSRDTVLKNLEQADFTVLLRTSKQRYAKAGFPTKVVESLASATPVMCNLTSDLGDFITDNYNGIIVKDCTANAFAFSVKKALKLTNEEKCHMQYNARKTAEKYFDYRVYRDEITKII